MSDPETVPAAEFERFFASGRDPYGFRTRWYEQRKRALTMSALQAPRYGRVLELGSAEGVLTELLADRANEVVAIDASSTAVERAVRTLADQRHVEVRRGTLPADFPAGEFDLVVMAEIGYFLSIEDLDVLVDRSIRALRPGGELIAVHWRERSDDYPLDGEIVHAHIRRFDGITQTVAHAEEEFLLEVWLRA